MGNGVKLGGKLSPLFNIYMDNLSAQRHNQLIRCSLGTAMVNLLLYADDLLLFAPSAKGLQALLDICYTYGCEHEIQYNAGKSQVLYFDSRNANLAREITLGEKKLNFATSYNCLVHIICNDLSDEADIQAKVRLLYAKSNMLRQTFHFCSIMSYLLQFFVIFTCVLFG